MIRRSPHTATPLRPRLQTSLLAAGLLTLVAGCQLLGPSHRSGGDPAAIVSDEAPPLGDPAEILSAEVQGETLVLRVRYSGGCAEHGWALYANRNATRSIPPQTTLALVHDANGDLCEALPTEELRFDLGAAIAAWRPLYPGELVLRIAVNDGRGGDVIATTITL